MQTTKSTQALYEQKSQSKNWRGRFWLWLGFNDRSSLKLYPGYGHADQMMIHGHALSFSALRRKKYSAFFLRNLLGLIRLFIQKPVLGSTIRLHWGDLVFETKTESDGFIKQEWHSDKPIPYGWHTFPVEMLNEKGEVLSSAEGTVLIPHSTQFGFISDIDDTFLISHSNNLRKRLSLLFTRNPRTRKPFEGVVNHYQLLAQTHTDEDEQNPFFYVSSSEWNLFDYIDEFILKNGLPKGVLLLSPMKTLSQLLGTGQKNHGSKFDRIGRILNAFPKQQFILLGDSSQQDPQIYASIVEHHPGRIFAVYIRDIEKKKSNVAKGFLQQMQDAGVNCCFFVHSIEAIAHSKKIGLIK